MEFLNLLRGMISNAIAPVVDVDSSNDVVAIRNKDGGLDLMDVRKYRGKLDRRAGNVVLQGVESFLSYVGDHDADALSDANSIVSPGMRTVMFINPQITRNADVITIGTAVLDYHDDLETPARCENTATLELRFHPMYRLVRNLFELQSQESFATNLRKIGPVFASPSSSDMLTLAQTLRVSSSSSYQSVSDPGTGSIDFVFQKTNTGTAGGYGEQKVTVPDIVKLSVPMFIGSESQVIECRFEFRAPKSPGDQVQMRLAYDAEAIDTHAAVEGVVMELEATGLQCLRGTYENKPIL